MQDDEVEFEFGNGKISGYLSVLLGISALFGVLCFHFPSLLTSEEFRKSYSEGFVRYALFIVLLISYLSGIVSYVLSKSKWLAVIGIGASFLASLLGGARIQVQEFESTSYSLGLDWFVLSLLFSMIIFIPIEKSFGLHKKQKILRKGWRTDMAYFFVSHLLIQFIFLFTTSVSEGLFSWTRYLPIQDGIRALPIVIQFLIATFVADLFQYGTHRIHHKVGFLWKFHAIHHSSESMDWLAGSRTHFVEVFVTRTLVMIPLYVCGFDQAALNAYITLVGVQAVMIHANLGINLGFLRYILATPQFHHWHHSNDKEYMDANYAVHLPIIDMMFGTYRCPKGKWPEEYGIVSGHPPKGFFQQFLHPFVRSKEDDTGAKEDSSKDSNPKGSDIPEN